MCYAFKSNNSFCIFMTSPLDTLFSINHFVCTCFFVDVYLQRFVHLETYAYERGLVLIGIPFLSSHLDFFPIIPWWLQICLVSACLILICIFAHSCVY